MRTKRINCTLNLVVIVALALSWLPVPAPVFAAPAPAEPDAPTALAVGSWQCDLSMGLTCFKSISSVTMVSASEGWAVGRGDAIIHYTTPLSPVVYIPFIRR